MRSELGRLNLLWQVAHTCFLSSPSSESSSEEYVAWSACECDRAAEVEGREAGFTRNTGAEPLERSRVLLGPGIGRFGMVALEAMCWSEDDEGSDLRTSKEYT